MTEMMKSVNEDIEAFINMLHMCKDIKENANLLRR